MQCIFIHGLGQNPSSWDETISYMPSSIQPTLLNLYNLVGNKTITYQNLYEAFSTYCNKLYQNNLECLNLCGLSLGGVLALNYAIEYPNRVQSLVLISVQYKMPKILLTLQNIIFKCMPKSSFKDIGFQKNDFIQLCKSMTNLDFSKELKKIICNTLIICGSNDSANMKACKRLTIQIQSELKIVKNAGHELNVDEPKKLAFLIKDFLFNDDEL